MKFYRGTSELENPTGRYWTPNIELARLEGHIVYRVDLVSTDHEASNLRVWTGDSDLESPLPMYDITRWEWPLEDNWWTYRLDSDRAINVFANRAIVHEWLDQ